LPYLMTLGPHMFAWFSLEAAEAGAIAPSVQYQIPALELTSSLDHFLQSNHREQLERALPDYLPYCRWFRSKAHKIRSCRIVDTIPMQEDNGGPLLTLVDVEFVDSEPETYLLPVALAVHDAADVIRKTLPRAILASVTASDRNGSGSGVLFDATGDPRFANMILETIGRKRHHRGIHGIVAGSQTGTAIFARPGLEPRALAVEQSNSSIAFGDQYILKFFRRVENGISPDLEIGRFLSANASFAHAPALAGWLEYRLDREEPRTLAVLQQFLPNQGDSWSYARNELDRYFERASVQQAIPRMPAGSILDLAAMEGPDPASSRMIGAFLEAARLLGRRVGELHLALAIPTDNPNFASETFTPFWHRSVYQSLRNLASQNLRLLRSQLPFLLPEEQPRAARLLEHPEWIDGRFEGFLRQPISSVRIRCHGDLHLGQILYTGNDFFIIDFEGEPARPLGERRRKRSVARDLAGMIRSFDYAASGTLLEMVRSGSLAGQDFSSMRQWASLWQRWTSASFLKEYLTVVANAPFVPQNREELQVLLDAFVLEKAIYELGYELNNRPAWVGIPLRGIESVLGVESD